MNCGSADNFHVSHEVGLEAESPPDPRDRRLRHARGRGHRPRRPVRVLPRPALFQGLGDDQLDLLIGDLPRGAWPRVITQALQPGHREPAPPCTSRASHAPQSMTTFGPSSSRNTTVSAPSRLPVVPGRLQVTSRHDRDADDPAGGERCPALADASAATWLFVLPLLTVVGGVVKVEIGGVALLAFVLIGSQQALPPGAVERIYLTFAVLALSVIAFVAFRSWPAAWAAGPDHTRALMMIATWVIVAAFAVLFFDEELFERVMWRAATVILWIGVVTAAASRFTGHRFLVNPADGTLRMVGTLSEPSAWAPILAIVLLLALRRRSRLYVTLSLIGLVLASSPTCLLVMAISVPLYYALAGTWRHGVPLLAALLVLIPAVGVFVVRADPVAWMASGNSAEVAVGRLMSGIRNVGTDGQEGTNSRFEDTAGVLATIRENGWMHFGAGPAADATYFYAVKPAHVRVAGVNALWVSVLFDYGEGGVVVLVLLMMTAASRMRRFPAMAAIFLPLFVASMVNSTVPDWTVAGLGMMLYGFGWAPGLARQAGMQEAAGMLPGEPITAQAGCAQLYRNS